MSLTKVSYSLINGAPYNVLDYGAVGDGVTNDQPAIQAAINAAGIQGGRVVFPAGKYLCNSTLTVTEGVFLVGIAAAKATTSSAATGNQAFLLHNFDGTFINVVGGTVDNAENSGFGLKDISLVQVYGNATADAGVAINVVATSDIQRNNWMVFDNINVETTNTNDDWTHCLVIDGTASTTGIRNVWMDNIRFVCGTYASGAVLLTKTFNVFMNGVMANLANADLDMDGGTSSVFLSNCTFADVNMDDASNVSMTGGSCATITTTSNSANSLFNTRATTSIALNAGSLLFMGSVNGVPTIQGGANMNLSLPQNRLTVSNAANIAGGVQIKTQGGIGGYGAGISMQSELAGGSGTIKEMARWAADGEAAWDGTAANQDASLGGWVTEDGTETKVVKFRKPSSAGQTAFYIFDYDNNQIEQVTVGAADSGGAGYKVLRIAN